MVSILTHTSVYTMKLSISLIHVYIYTIRFVKPKHIAPVRYTQNVFLFRWIAMKLRCRTAQLGGERPLKP